MREIAPNIYVSTEYAGVNVGLFVAPAGAIAIDVPTLPWDARAWREQILEIAEGPIMYVILTDVHPDRLLSAGLMGAPIVAAWPAYERASEYTDGFWRGVLESWNRRLAEGSEELTREFVVLPEIMFTERLRLQKGGADLKVKHIAGSTPESAWVRFREQRVLFVGDTLVVGQHPFLDAASDTKGWLNTLTDLRRPRFAKTTIVPGRGPICDQSDTRPLSDYIALVRRRARSLLRGDCTRSEKAAVVTDLMPSFPVPEEQSDLIQRRVKAGLDQVCEELGQD